MHYKEYYVVVRINNYREIKNCRFIERAMLSQRGKSYYYFYICNLLFPSQMITQDLGVFDGSADEDRDVLLKEYLSRLCEVNIEVVMKVMTTTGH